jgi:hypothetical protein
MPYGFESTAEEIARESKVDLNCKNVIVTGGYAGLFTFQIQMKIYKPNIINKTTSQASNATYFNFHN